jgi:hypothetical protein
VKFEAIIPAKAGIQIENIGFLVEAGMTAKAKGLLTQYTKNIDEGETDSLGVFFEEGPA